MDPFALLEDRLTGGDCPVSRHYTDFSHQRRCTEPATLDAFWQGVDEDLANGLHAVLLIDYEWGVRLQLDDPASRAAKTDSALTVLLFRRLEFLTPSDCEALLGTAVGSGLLPAAPDIDKDVFDAAIDSIHKAIHAGETYQINYTYRLRLQAYGEPLDLYRRLRERQLVAYGAFIQMPEGSATSHVLSFSPELFLNKTGPLLEARPMKGTAPVSGDDKANAEAAAALAADEKNRAENLMIVDLLRNDLGRIALTGSVKVPQLFTVEQFETVLQMTSTVTGELDSSTAFPEILRALFPCGSITGAPKHRTMQIIDSLEASPRGLYTGAIGWLDAARDGSRCGDFCLSVAIRTLTLRPDQSSGLWQGEMGIGAGIVIDSEADAEFEECRLKGRFLTGLTPDYALFETMLVRGREIRHLSRHLHRLAASAKALGFHFDEARARVELAAEVAALPQDVDHRLRLQLEFNGSMSIRTAPLAPLINEVVTVRLATEPLGSDLPLVRHKTTLRARYDSELALADAQGAFDTLCFNSHGELTEGARSNVFVKLDGAWFTPPLSAGVLPGIMRSMLLEDPELAASERPITLASLERAEAMIVCNSLRGPLRAKLTRG